MTNKFSIFNFQFSKPFFRYPIALTSIIFLAVSCNPFKQPPLSGVARTNNGGADWQTSHANKDDETTIAALNVAKMDFDPKNRETIFVSGFNDGLYKSEDSGASWSRILSKIWAFDFAIHPAGSQIIYAAGFFADRGMVVKTKDGGKSWEEVYSEAQDAVSVRSVALNPYQPNQVIIGNSAGSLIKSNDGGITWKLVKNFDGRINRVYWLNGQVYVLVREKGLFKSTNLEAGEFLDLTGSLTKSQGFLESFGGLNEKNFNQAHIDSITPSLIYLTAGKGAVKTTDEGITWQKLNLLGKQGSELPARAVAVSKQSSNIVFVSVGKVVYKSTDGGASWQTQTVPSSGFVNYILIDPQLPQVAYAGNFVAQ